MTILLTIRNITKSFGTRPLFQNIDFTIEQDQRLGLIGPNGAGKSSLLRILAGKLDADSGEVLPQRGLKIGFLEQVPQFAPQATVRQILQEAAGDAHDGRELARVEEYLSKLSLDGSRGVAPDDLVSSLSGGWKKRVALARELLREPGLLLLDEPTNHLDVESILWLEQFLQRADCGLVTVTHDRVFLQRVSDRILELDPRNPRGLLSVKGNYADYLETKEQVLAQQSEQELKLKNTLRRETEWLRQGAKARSTKQQARIQRAEVLAEDVKALESRNRSRGVELEFLGHDRQPKKLIEAKSIAKTKGDRLLFQNFNLRVTPGSRVGLLGINGCGKSTLLKVLLGEEAPDEGEVFRAEAISVAYFEQNREALDPNLTLARTLCPSGDQVLYRGVPVHVRGYLDRFLFRQEQTEMKVAQLSGGEQSRLLIARLLLQPANVLVLDEPTNDLDLETLDVLEAALIDFPGAVLLVTHDRFFLHRVATQIVAFPEDSAKLELFADLDQWENWREERKKAAKTTAKSQPTSSSRDKKRKLSFNEQRELDLMEGNILKAEEELERLTKALGDPENISNAERLLELHATMSACQKKIENMYARWEELETLRKEIS